MEIFLLIGLFNEKRRRGAPLQKPSTQTLFIHPNPSNIQFMVRTFFGDRFAEKRLACAMRTYMPPSQELGIRSIFCIKRLSILNSN
jgi:hypothetical protein